MKRRVAIVGLGKLTHDLAPFTDREWQCWGLPWDNGFWVNYDALFEMHDRSLFEHDGALRPPSYLDRLSNQVWKPLYMQEAQPDMPTSVAYPFEAVADDVFKDYPRADQKDWYNSSFAYMMALAIHERFSTISIFGFEMHGQTEEQGSYIYQLPNANMLVGIAMGRGIDVIVPVESMIGKFAGEGMPMGKMNPVYPRRYGSLR